MSRCRRGSRGEEEKGGAGGRVLGAAAAGGVVEAKTKRLAARRATGERQKSLPPPNQRSRCASGACRGLRRSCARTRGDEEVEEGEGGRGAAGSAREEEGRRLTPLFFLHGHNHRQSLSTDALKVAKHPSAHPSHHYGRVCYCCCCCCCRSHRPRGDPSRPRVGAKASRPPPKPRGAHDVESVRHKITVGGLSLSLSNSLSLCCVVVRRGGGRRRRQEERRKNKRPGKKMARAGAAVWGKGAASANQLKKCEGARGRKEEGSMRGRGGAGGARRGGGSGAAKAIQRKKRRRFWEGPDASARPPRPPVVVWCC